MAVGDEGRRMNSVGAVKRDVLTKSENEGLVISDLHFYAPSFLAPTEVIRL